MNIIAIIPARMAASRFPGKPLHKMLGYPMIGHIYQRAKMCSEFDGVYIATCDEDIKEFGEEIGASVVMTSDSHPNCIDRTVEAMHLIEKQTGKTIDYVAMVQGDEPTVTPTLFSESIKAIKENPNEALVNIMGTIKEPELLGDKDVVKVVVDKNSYAMYMSREPIPTLCKGKTGPMNKQTGLIFFKREKLLEFSQLEPTPLESSEFVDMLRFLENGIKIKMIGTDSPCLSVDTPTDAKKVIEVLESDPLTMKYLL